MLGMIYFYPLSNLVRKVAESQFYTQARGDSVICSELHNFSVKVVIPSEFQLILKNLVFSLLLYFPELLSDLIWKKHQEKKFRN